MIEIGRLLVFVRKNGPRGEGPILYAEPPLAQEIEKWNGATDIGDLNFETSPPQCETLDGLVIWEGWIEWTRTHGDEDGSELEMHGDWRKLSHWEMCRVRDGRPPWVPGR